MDLATKVSIPKDISDGGPLAIMEWIIDAAIWIYSYSEVRNDFFLLHGITSSWSLRQLLPIFQDVELQMSMCQTFLCILFAAYLAQGFPQINPENKAEDPGVADIKLDSLINKALEQNSDEHAYKLMQVVKERNVNNPSNTELYRRAAYNVLYYDFHFVFEEGV